VTNKTYCTFILQICVATAALWSRPGSAFAASGDDSKSDLEVSAASASAVTGANANVPTAANSASIPGPSEHGAQGATPGAPQASVPMLPSSSGPPTVPISPAAAPTTGSMPVNAANATPPVATEQAPLKSSEPSLAQLLTEGYRISGYFQTQHESHQDSEDQLNQSMGLLNQNRFVLRRGRVRIGRDWDYASVLVEFDGNTVRGPAFRWQKAEASLVYGRSKKEDVAPLVQFTMGIFDLPFGYELVESPKSRPFMERSLGGRALWPSEPDVGARLSGQVKFLRYAVALTNGEPLDEKSGFGLQDPNNNKDVTVRLGAITSPWPKVTASGDITYNAGRGFHPGTAATKSAIAVWQDKDHNGLVSADELVGSPTSAATPSMNFSRWALGADVQFAFETKLGKSMIYGEIVVAQNLDRGLFISDPNAVGGTVTRQLSYYVAFVQQITPYGLVGFRTDFYNPNADFFDQRAGQQIPTSQSIRNYSPIAGLVLPDRAKLLVQYDIQSNLLGRDTSGVPTHYANNTLTLRLQVNL
jgi:hypothetical protein